MEGKGKHKQKRPYESSAVAEGKADKKAKHGATASSPAAQSNPLKEKDKFDIDALFKDLGEKKAQKQLQPAPKPPAKDASKLARKQEADAIAQLEKAGRKTNRMRAPDSPTPLRTDPHTGMPIFSIDALKIGQGKGDTPLCPFDCECCY